MTTIGKAFWGVTKIIGVDIDHFINRIGEVDWLFIANNWDVNRKFEEFLRTLISIACAAFLCQQISDRQKWELQQSEEVHI